jgi:pyridoxine 5-phosphate synthase
MARLAVNIDAIAAVRNLFGESVPDPAHMTVLAEMGGAESITCHFRKDQKSVNERDLRVISEIVKTHLNIRSDIQSDHIRKLMTIKPHMISFVSSGEKNIEPLPADLHGNSDILANFVADIRANDILSNILIEPDINLIKLAAKLEFDYIELWVNSYSHADDLDQQIAELEHINSLIDAAGRLGLGVNASGGLNQENLNELSKIPLLDDLIVGNPILVKSLAIGFEQAVRDFVSILR